MKRKKDNEENRRFLHLIKSYPCIYNFQLAEYSDREFVESAWKNISKELGEPVDTLKEKWRNIRTVFLRRLRAEQRGLQIKHKYYLMEDMQFLMPYIKVSVPLSESLNESQLVYVTKHEIEKADYAEEEIIEDNTMNCYVENEGTSAKIFKESRTSGTEEMDYVVVPGPSKPSKPQPPPVNLDDDNPRKLFLMSLVPEVKQMNDRQMNKFRMNVLRIIDDILYADDD